MNSKVLKYLLDIESILEEIQQVLDRTDNDYLQFSKDQIAKRAVERHLEIIGEAVNQLIKLDHSIKITRAKRIVSLRNLIIHSYDSVNDEIIWGILHKDIPKLKQDIKEIRKTD